VDEDEGEGEDEADAAAAAAAADDDDDTALDDGAATDVFLGMLTMMGASSMVNAATPTRPIRNGEAESDGEEEE